MRVLFRAHGRVVRVLIDVAVAVQRRLDIGGVERMLRRETVEAAAPHEEEKVDQHIAFGAQLALVSGLTQDARARKAAPVAKAREGDFNELQAVQIRDQPPRLHALLAPNRRTAGLSEKAGGADRTRTGSEAG